jgi:hypothetical protein
VSELRYGVSGLKGFGKRHLRSISATVEPRECADLLEELESGSAEHDRR